MARLRTPGRMLAAGLAVGVIATGGALAAMPASAASDPAAERYAPSRVPDRITLLPAGDPTTQQVVSWRSSTAVTRGIVEYRSFIPTPYPGGVQSVEAQHRVEQTTDLGYTSVVHTATVSGLQPGAAYQYRVGDGTNFSEWQDFETADPAADSFSFIYLGDVQNGILADASRVVRNAFRDRPNADLVLQIGDLVDDAESEQHWGELYEAFSYTLGTQNLLTTPGNHEYEGGLSEQWQNQYTYPDNGPEGEGGVYDELDGTVYYTDHQGVRFVSLNSNVVDTEGLAVQAEWLDQVLADNPHEWSVVYFHHPVYSLDEGRNNLGIRQSWGPILEEHNVDLVLTGHDHAYGRGNLLANEKNLPAGADPALSSTGPVYVSSSVGSKFYDAGPRHWNENGGHLRRLETGLQTYQVIDVAGGTLRFESRTADGKFFDGFTITKSGNTKLVVDGVEPQVIDPGTPSPCLGCEPNPGEEPVDPTEPEEPAGAFDYAQTAQLDAVMPASVGGAHTAALPAGVAYHQARDVLYLGDQNSRKVFEIDPDTDTVLRSFELPENIRDLGIDEQNEVLYVGQQNKNWVVVSLADATFGQVVRGPYPIIESQRSIDVDPVNDYVYVAVPARGVEVFRASTGESLGVVRGTADAYYVAADPATGTLVTTKFAGVAGAPDIQAFDAVDGFTPKWEKEVRPGARQLDVDSERGLLYIGYTGTSADRGGFSVHSLASGAQLVDKVGPDFGKDGYGITVDEDEQRVFVANRDFRLNPPGEELVPYAVTESTRIPEPASETFAYEAHGHLDAVQPNAVGGAHTAALPAGVAYDQQRDLLYLGDQNSRKIFEIDPDTDTVRREMTLPENIRDLGIDEERQLLYVGQQNKNWLVVSTADATFGQVVRGPFPIIESQRSIDVDPVNDYVYVAVPARGVEVFRASTGESLGVINGTADAYYVAADSATGTIVTTAFRDVEGAIGVQAFDATAGFAKTWEKAVRPGARQVDIDSERGLLYIGYTGTSAERGGFSVHALSTGEQLADMVGPAFGKDGYGIVVDEEDQRVFVANRDFRLNPPGEELEPKAVTVSIRVEDDGPVDPTDPEEPTEPTEPTGPDYPAETWAAAALTAIPTETAEGADEIRPVGTVVDPATGLLYVADEMRPARVHVVDPKTDEIVRTITAPTTDPVGDGLRDIARDPATGHLTVAFGSNWVVMDEAGAAVAGPFAFSGGVRGMDVDPAGARVFGATRGTGFEVRDAATGALVHTVEGPADGGAWRTHGVAYDAANDRIYVSNSDAAGSTEGIRVYDGVDYTLIDELAVDGADFRSIAVDPATNLVVVGHQGTLFDQSGVSVYTGGLSLVERLEEHRYGNKVYGVSIDPTSHALFVSARDRFPAGLVRVTLPAEALAEPEPPVADWASRALVAIPTETVEGEPEKRTVGSAVDPATGHVFVADEMRPARVHVIDPVSDTIVRTLSAPTADPVEDGLRDLAYDAQNGWLYVGYGSNWLVMDAETGALVRGPFAFAGGVRGLDVDLERGLVYGATRGTGFEVANASTGEIVTTIEGPADGGAWRSHGIAYDPVADLLYVGNSDAGGSTEGIRVYSGADHTLLQRQQVAGADYRSLAVDGSAGIVVAGNQSTTFDQSGVTVFAASDLTVLQRLSKHEYGNKVYGVSIDAERDLLYVSARDRYPAGLIQVTLPRS